MADPYYLTTLECGHELFADKPCPYCRVSELERSLDQAAAEYVWDALKLDEDSPDYELTKQRVLQRWLDIHKIPGEE